MKEAEMQKWEKPKITQIESGMEVTSYLPAELDRPEGDSGLDHHEGWGG